MHGLIRLERRRLRLLLLALPLLAAAGLLAGAVLFGARPRAPAPNPAAAPAGNGAGLAGDPLPAAPGLLVHVSGAVEHPGLYRLQKGDRVHAAIEAAGGLSVRADPDRLPNLAGRLRDGEQVKVPFKAGKAGARGPGLHAARVDLNSATPAELLTVPGFDAELASAVIAHRTQYGGFASARELVTVCGMSEAEYVVARRYLRV
jgi:competence protein ComEA